MTATEPDAPEADWRELLRSAGLRVTQPRLAVLDAVRSNSHLAADQVSDRVRARIGTVSTQAVYDALNTLTEHQILRRIEPAGSPMLFELNRGDNHHHIVCRRCGAVADVACAVGSMPCAVPRETHGFTVEEAEVTYWGTCPDCSSSPNRPD
jgi:Fur family ferric uptake transcriptional regulator